MNKPKVRLLADRVLVHVLPEQNKEKKLPSGIIIPATVKESDSKTEYATVVRASKQIAENAKEWEKVEEGETVAYSSFAGSEVKFEGETYKVLRFTDIYFVLE